MTGTSGLKLSSSSQPTLSLMTLNTIIPFNFLCVFRMIPDHVKERGFPKKE